MLTTNAAVEHEIVAAEGNCSRFNDRNSLSSIKTRNLLLELELETWFTSYILI